MKIAYVGCGFVFDIYMRTRWAYPELEVCGVFDIDTRRAGVVGQYYGYKVYPTLDALLADPQVEVVVNLTSIKAHYEVTKRCLDAGKHVYSEKPLTLDVAQAKELFELAARRGLVLSGAPCNLFSDSIATIWKALREGAIGKPLLVYAELDENPIYLLGLENSRSPTGAPWPFVDEYQEGCTLEHLGYHLAWICALFGPVVSMTAFSKALVEEKTTVALDPPDTPDFSVACLNFNGGVVARITCSIVAPRDHGMRIIGDEGMLTADTYRQFRTDVRLERFSTVSLNARKSRSVRSQPIVGKIFGVGGRRLPLVRQWKSYAVESDPAPKSSLKRRLMDWLRRREVYAQDKLLGIAEMVRRIEARLPQRLPADFLVHVTELTLLTSRAGDRGFASQPTTTFEPFDLAPALTTELDDYRTSYRPPLFERLFGKATGRALAD
jgi:predicted dehydrogenase